MKTIIWAAVVLLGLLIVPARAQVYQLHLTTDNAPDYTDLESFVTTSTGVWQTPQEKAVAVWRWGRRSRRQTSCAVEGGRYILDPILHYNSYGAMNCGIISGLNVTCWLQLGYKARYIQLGDHTVSEVSWDDGASWHLFDSSMSFYCFNHEGQVASCEEIKQAQGCERSDGKVEPGHYYLYHGAPQVASHLGPGGWRCAADQPVGYKRLLSEGAASYTDGFSVDRYCQHARSGHRYVLNLRPFECYTRHWRPLDDVQNNGDTATNDPDYFRPLANGSDPDDQHDLNNIRGNGVWDFCPDLAASDRETSFYDSENMSSVGTGSPLLHPAKAGVRGSVTWQISAANVITSLRLEASGLRKTAADELRILVSRNAGIRWQQVWQAKDLGPQSIQLKLRDEVAGGTQCWIKFEMLAADGAEHVGLDDLKITTLTQLNRRALPLLTLGSNQVMLHADEQLETVEIWPPLHAGRHKESVVDERDVFSDALPDGMYKATLGAAVNNTPGTATWRLAVPTEIADVTCHVISTVRGPRHYVSLQHSWDGKRFNEFHRRDKDDFPMDQRVVGAFSGDQVPAAAREFYFRGEFFSPSGAGTYNMAGIQDLLVRVHHRPRKAQFRPIEVTYNWTEHRDSGDVTRSHTEMVRELPYRYTINVAGRRDPTMNWVRIGLQASVGQPGEVRYGYSDGVDVGTAYEVAKVCYRWGNLISVSKEYSASRPSTARSGNPDTDGKELTNRIVIAPTDYMRSAAVQPAVAYWDAGEPVCFVVDLGQVETVGGVRIATHQPNAEFCHPQAVEVAVSADGASWQPAGMVRHDDLWRPSGDYEPWEHDDDPSYADLPAGGRLAYSYPLAFKRPVEARYVRFTCAPLNGKGMGLSELQVYDHVTVHPWPNDIYVPRPFALP